MRSRALVCDMDGTLLDSEPMHFAVARGIFAGGGLDFTLALNAEFIGQSSQQVMSQASQASQAAGGVTELLA